MNILVTGGAGFVGANLTKTLAAQGHNVTVFDNLSRQGSQHNLRWLRESAPRLTFHQGDVRDANSLAEAMKPIDAVYHLAAQVAVTTSVTDPRTDFDVNLLGSLNVLEAVRKQGRKIPVLFSSTNKVYGKLEVIPVVERATRYEFERNSEGVSEATPLDFYSPYGCSKGGADQYIHDYARIYGIPTVVFRMSCIYGERQMGNEDQGWVAHFLIQAARRAGVSVYGDGKQIRDLLYVGDLVRLFITALERIDSVSGDYFNVGGGSANTLSLLELIQFIREDLGIEFPVTFSDWRPGDQKVYVSSIAKVKAELGWSPEVSVRTGLHRLYTWISANPDLFRL